MDNIHDEMNDESCTGSDDLVEYTLDEQEEEQDDLNTGSADDLEELMEVSSVPDEQADEDFAEETEKAMETKPANTILNVSEIRNSGSILKCMATWNEKNNYGDKFKNKVTVIQPSASTSGAMKLLNSANTSHPTAAATTSYRLVNTDGTMVMNVGSQSQTAKKVFPITSANVLQQTNSKVLNNQTARVIHIRPRQLPSASGNVVKALIISKRATTPAAVKPINATAVAGVSQPTPGTSTGAPRTFVRVSNKAESPGNAQASPRIINSVPTNGISETTKVIIQPSNASTTKKKSTSPNLVQRYVPGIKRLQYVRVLNPRAPTGSGSPPKMIIQTLNKVSSANTAIQAVASTSTAPLGSSKIIVQNNRTFLVRNGIAKVATTASAVGGKASVLPAGRKIILAADKVQPMDKHMPGTADIVLKAENINTVDAKPVRAVIAKLPEATNNTSLVMEDDHDVIMVDSKQHVNKIASNISANTSGGKVMQDDIDASRRFNSAYGFPEEAYKKRPCNCTKSQCLKLYCDCFANGEYCYNCNCKDCYNTLEHENERDKAIRCTLERNPNAFKPKIGSIGATDDGTRLHTKGCNCKRSGCLKNYCECYEAKIPCSSNCKCVGCRNTDQFAQEFDYFGVPDGSAKSADEATQRVSGKHNAVAMFSDSGDYVASEEQPASVSGLKRSASYVDVDVTELPPAKQPHNFMTLDVIEATVQCMVAQADECMKRGCSIRTSERMILEEFGRCLLEIKEFAFKRDN